MKRTRIAVAAFVSVSAAAITIASASSSEAANPATAGYGARQQLLDPNGAVVAAWTVSDVQPSSDLIPYIPAGKLYEATAVIEADQNPVTPIIGNFNARAADGGTYRALSDVPAALGLNPSALPPGGKTAGKIYFDVTGANPTSIAYNDGAQDLLIWTPGATAPANPAPAAPPTTSAAPPPPPATPAAATPAPPTTSTPASATLPAAAGSMPSGYAPAGATGASSAATGSMPSGTTPAGGTTTGVSGISAGSAGPGANPAGKT